MLLPQDKWQTQPTKFIFMAQKNGQLLNSLYWVTTLVTILWMYAGSFAALLGAEFMTNTIQKLGYPDYFHFMLGGAKFIGASLILFSPNRWLKAFAYAGVFYELMSSILSYSLSGYYLETIAPFVFFIIVGGSFYCWIKRNDLKLVSVFEGKY
jgi:ABC-type enterobactin transport system permease subunit